MRFQIPQFIETEAKLVGPFTLKQFLWVAAGASILYLAFILTGGSFWFYLLAIPVSGISLAFAFLKIDGTPLINYVVYGLGFAFRSKKYVFHKEDGTINTDGQ